MPGLECLTGSARAGPVFVDVRMYGHSDMKKCDMAYKARQESSSRPPSGRPRAPTWRSRAGQGRSRSGVAGSAQDVVRLDHLEVVIAHRRGRAGLEGGVPPGTGPHVDRAHRLVLPGHPRGRSRARPSDGSPRTVRRWSRGSRSRSCSARRRRHGWPPARPGRRRPVAAGRRRSRRSPPAPAHRRLPQLTADGPDVPGRRTGGTHPLRQEDSRVRHDRGDLAQQVPDQVHPVRRQVAEDPAPALVPPVAPGQRAVRIGRVVAEEPEPAVRDPADRRRRSAPGQRRRRGRTGS